MKLIEIYESLKTNNFLDVVAIQHGYFCRVYDDDAIWMNEKWGWKIAEHKVRGKVDHIYTGFYSKNKKLYAERFKKLGIPIIILDDWSEFHDLDLCEDFYASIWKDFKVSSLNFKFFK